MCVLLVLSLCAPVLALAAPSSTVLVTRGGTLHDHACQRPSAPSLFTLIPLHGGESDPGRLAAAVEHHAPRSRWTAGPRTGRSPPTIS